MWMLKAACTIAAGVAARYVTGNCDTTSGAIEGDSEIRLLLTSDLSKWEPGQGQAGALLLGEFLYLDRNHA